MTIEDVLKKVEFEEKWLLSAGYNAYNADIAFHTIKWAIKQLSTNPKMSECVSRMSEKQIDGDLISRDFMKKLSATCIAKRSETGELVAISSIDNLPSAEKTAEWIPVSERLPEVMDGTNGECSDDVLICVADDEQITISTGFYGYYPQSKLLRGWWSMWAYGCHHLDSKYKVIAWMPLPEPYKAESEE